MAALAAGCAGARLPAHEERSLDAMLQEVLCKHDAPAVAALVAEHGTVIAQGAVGVCARDGISVELGDSWHIGSCAKAMTAFALQQLVEARRLSWHATMAEVFPELANDMHARMRTVTVAQLVDHRSGLPENHRAGSAFTRQIDRRADPMQQRLEITATALADPPVGEPGVTYTYANTNYLIAGAVLERISAGAWRDAMQRLVFAPLGMTTAGIGQPDRVLGHQRMFGKAIPTRVRGGRSLLPVYYGPSGDVHMSLRDWLKFAHACMSLDGLQAEQGYRRGFAVRGDALAHHGSSPWWRAFVHIDRATGRVVLVACNHGGDVGAAVTADVAAQLLR